MERPYKRFVAHPDFEVPVPGRASVIGFLVAILLAGCMVVGLQLLVMWLKGRP